MVSVPFRIRGGDNTLKAKETKNETYKSKRKRDCTKKKSSKKPETLVYSFL